MKQLMNNTKFKNIFQSNIAVITIYILSRILKSRMALSITFHCKKIYCKESIQ